jgi:hypothetical protein
MTKLLLKPGVYRHYKGQLYQVLGVALLEETLEPMVVYQALHDSQEVDPNALWVRPLQVFLETVNTAGKEQPRFEFVSDSPISLETYH